MGFKENVALTCALQTALYLVTSLKCQSSDCVSDRTAGMPLLKRTPASFGSGQGHWEHGVIFRLHRLFVRSVAASMLKADACRDHMSKPLRPPDYLMRASVMQ